MRGSPRATCDAAKSAIPTPRGRRQPGRPPRRRPRRRRSARLGPRPNNGDTAREPTIACLWVEHLALLFLALENPDRPLEQRDRGLANGSLLRFPCQSGRRGHPEGQRDALPVCIGRLVFEDELGRHAGRGRNREFCLGIHRSTVRPRRPVRLSLTSGARACTRPDQAGDLFGDGLSVHAACSHAELAQIVIPTPKAIRRLESAASALRRPTGSGHRSLPSRRSLRSGAGT